MSAFSTIDPLHASPAQLYDLLVGAIQPRPIALVSTRCPEGIANLAPFSYFMPGGSNPLSLALSVAGAAEGRKKDTLLNIEQTGEFVVNTVDRAMVDGMNQASGRYVRSHSEWGETGFSPLASEVVSPMRVGEAPLQLECRLFSVVTHGFGPGCANYVIGEVVRVHVRADLWDGERLRHAPIARLGGEDYLDTAALERFQLSRPQ